MQHMPPQRPTGVSIGRYLVLALCATGGSCNILTVLFSHSSVRTPSFTLEAAVEEPPAQASVVDATDPVELSLGKITIVDQLGNEFEKALLRDAGVVAPSPPEGVVQVGTGSDGMFSQSVINELTAAVRDVKASKSSTVESVGLDDLLEIAKTALRDKLRAKYTLQVVVRPRTFDGSSQDNRSFTLSRVIPQTQLAEPITAVETTSLLFRGRAGDIMYLDARLTRDSLIARFLADELRAAKDSTFFADTLEGILAATPLGSFGGKAGKTIGSWIDGTLYRALADRATPLTNMADSTFMFLSKSGKSLPTDPETAWYHGDRALRIDALLDQPSSNAAPIAPPSFRMPVLRIGLNTKRL